MDILKLILIIVLTGICFITDIRENKIYNKVIVIFLITGLSINVVSRGFSGLYDSILGIILPIAILAVLFVLRMFGAGDLKLFAAIGSIMGYNFALNNIIYSLFAAAVLAIIMIILNRDLLKRFKYFFIYMANSFMAKNAQEYDKSTGKMPLAVGIFLGTIVQLIIRYSFISM